jgi:hypothetical protein
MAFYINPPATGPVLINIVIQAYLEHYIASTQLCF